MDKQAFYASLRAGILGPKLEQNEVDGCEAILAAMAGAPLAYCAYAFGTAFHETAFTLQPIKELGGPRYFTKMYDVNGDRPALARKNGNTIPGDGARFFGRGYVQLTWRANYRRATEKTGFPLEGNPDLALRPDIAAQIMRSGMDEGWFTGKAFRHYLPASGPATIEQFTSARRIINGTDKAATIAGYAMKFQAALQAGGWA